MTLTILRRGLLAVLALSLCSVHAAGPPKPLRALLFVGGGYHDYATLAPHLVTNLSRLVNITFDVKDNLEPLRDPKFADGYDVVVYDWCFDQAPDDVLDHALKTTAEGKPTVMIHCAVHAFRNSPKIGDWETCCGMRSKVHDKYEPFTVQQLDPENPITKFFPDGWKTPGDELYQTISMQTDAQQLLKVKSPQDGHEHVVCWTCRYKKGPVFATTLGHDMKTSTAPEYLRLLANGILSVCGKLGADGNPVAGYEGPKVR